MICEQSLLQTANLTQKANNFYSHLFLFTNSLWKRRALCRYSQARADVLRSSSRQSFVSPMMGQTLSLAVGEYSDETDACTSAPHFYTRPLCSRRGLGGSVSALIAQSPTHLSVWRDKRQKV